MALHSKWLKVSSTKTPVDHLIGLRLSTRKLRRIGFLKQHSNQTKQMKKILVTMLAAAATVASSYAQGTINFVNTASQLITIEGTSATSAQGAKVQLLWAPAGSTDLGLFQPVGGAANVGIPIAGRFSGGVVTVPVTPAGGVAAFVVQGYVGGDFASALTRGTSSIFEVDLGDPTTVPAGTPAAMTAFGGVNLTIVPEPTTMALAGLGAASLLLFRRRK
jgi:hypothetical protein